MRVRRHLLGSLPLAVVLLASLAGGVSAGSKTGIYEEGSWDEPFTDTVCDAGYQVEGRWWGHWQTRNATSASGGQFFPFSQQFNLRSTVTNPANGKSAAEELHGKFKEVNPRAHGDDPNVFTFETVEVGLYTIRKASGKLVFADPYTIVTRRVFDTFGDSAPGGEELSYEELVNTTDRSFDFCALMDKTIG